MQQVINGKLLSNMLQNAAVNLENNKHIIDALNVFPVPDGDTGTNMSLTMNNAILEIKKQDTTEIPVLVDSLSIGALKGARGNSGVILSQIFRGFAKAVDGNSEIDAKLFAEALQSGVLAAYKGVMKPKEGTILTVARESADAGRAAADRGEDIEFVLDAVIKEGHASLERTPELLEVLKQANVVDAGGKGLLVIYEGFRMALDGVLPETIKSDELSENLEPQDFADIHDLDNITYTYCTEFLIQNLELQDADTEILRLRERLSMFGDSTVVVGDERLIKVHLHTDAPGKALQQGLALGELDRIKIENMREQNREILNRRMMEKKDIAYITISAGKGIDEMFKGLLADGIVSGGQSMNPSTEDILAAIKRAPSDNVIVLPNNKNIFLAAQQAAEISGKNVHVIQTKNIVQGMAAAIIYHPEMDFATNIERMEGAIEEVSSVNITKAVRDSKVDGIEVKEGDIIGIFNGQIISKGDDKVEVAASTISKGIEGFTDGTITIFYGADISEEDAEEFSNNMQEEYPDCDIELHYGGQPLYDYLIAIEN